MEHTFFISSKWPLIVLLAVLDVGAVLWYLVYIANLDLSVDLLCTRNKAFVGEEELHNNNNCISSLRKLLHTSVVRYMLILCSIYR